MKLFLRNITLAFIVLLIGSKLVAVEGKKKDLVAYKNKKSNLLSMVKDIKEGRSSISNLPEELRAPAESLLRSNNNLSAAYLNVKLDKSLSEGQKDAIVKELKACGSFYYSNNLYIKVWAKGINWVFLNICGDNKVSLEEVKILLDTNKVNINCFNNNGETALIKAIKNANLKLVKLLVEYGACSSFNPEDLLHILKYAAEISEENLKLGNISKFNESNVITKFLFDICIDLHPVTFLEELRKRCLLKNIILTRDYINPALIVLLEEVNSNQKQLFPVFVSILAKIKADQI